VQSRIVVLKAVHGFVANELSVGRKGTRRMETIAFSIPKRELEPHRFTGHVKAAVLGRRDYGQLDLEAVTVRHALRARMFYGDRVLGRAVLIPFQLKACGLGRQKYRSIAGVPVLPDLHQLLRHKASAGAISNFAAACGNLPDREPSNEKVVVV